MKSLIILIVILILLIYCTSYKQETFECVNKDIIPNRQLKFIDAVDTINCNQPVELLNGKDPRNYDSYKLTMKISKMTKFQNIENNVEYNICGGIDDQEKISWRLYLKLSPTTDYVLKDFRYDLFLQINNSNPIYIPSISSINKKPVRASFQFNKSYEIIIYRTKQNCYIGAVETFSNSPKNRIPEFKMDLYTLYDSPSNKSDIKEIIYNNKFFSSNTVPKSNKSIKLLGGTGSCILEAYLTDT